MSQRLFSFFHGSDKDYIEFLECQLISAQWAGQWAGLTDFETPPRCETTGEARPPENLQIMQYTPDLQASKRANLPQWQKELHVFISALPAEASWNDARKRAGIDTPVKNQLALRLMLGYTNVAVFRSGQDDLTQPPMLRMENQELVSRGYQYAGFISRCANGLTFTKSVTAFQSLIFVSYCVVMRQSGISTETTNDMMRRYFVSKNSDKTLEAYRRGVVWIHRCIAELLANGWGHKSWEVFLLGMIPSFLL